MYYKQTWKGTTYVDFTLDDVAEWACVSVEAVDKELIRRYVWDYLSEAGFDIIEFMYGE